MTPFHTILETPVNDCDFLITTGTDTAEWLAARRGSRTMDVSPG